MCYFGGMSDSRKRRVRKRLTIELDPEEEVAFREVRLEAVRQGLTLREYVLYAAIETAKRHSSFRRAERDGR